ERDVQARVLRYATEVRGRAQRTRQVGPLDPVEVGEREILRARVQVELPLRSEPARDAQRRLAAPERQVLDLEPRLVPVQRQVRLAGVERFAPEREIAELQRGRSRRR